MTSRTLDGRAGASLLFKCENLQSASSFEARGATDVVLQLTVEEAAHGVVTHSRGTTHKDPDGNSIGLMSEVSLSPGASGT